MSAQHDEFVEEIAPDYEQTLELVRDALWQLGQSTDTVGPTPATTWLPLLEEAAAVLENARAAAVNQLLPDSRFAVKMAHAQSANPFWGLANKYPEVRRVCVVDVALFAVQWAIDDLQKEGQPPVQQEALKLSRTKRTS